MFFVEVVNSPPVDIKSLPSLKNFENKEKVFILFDVAELFNVERESGHRILQKITIIVNYGALIMNMVNWLNVIDPGIKYLRDLLETSDFDCLNEYRLLYLTKGNKAIK